MSKAGTRTIDELRADIQRTRAELADTMQALVTKADVRSMARSRALQARQQVRVRVTEAAAWVRTSTARRANTSAGVVLGVVVLTLAGTALLRPGTSQRGSRPAG